MNLDISQLFSIAMFIIALFLCMTSIPKSKSFIMQIVFIVCIFFIVGTLFIITDLPINGHSDILYLLIFSVSLVCYSFTLSKKKNITDQLWALVMLIFLFILISFSAVSAQEMNKGVFNYFAYSFAYIPFLITLLAVKNFKNVWCKFCGLFLLYLGVIIFIVFYFLPYCAKSQKIIPALYDTIFYCTNLDINIDNSLKPIRLRQYLSFSLLHTFMITLILNILYEMWQTQNNHKNMD